MEREEISVYRTTKNSFDQLAQVRGNESAKVIRVMHSEMFTSLKGIGKCRLLEEAIFSSNAIDKMEFLQSLQNLRFLNLSCNKIARVSGLGKLFRLESLNLSHNKITSLQGLEVMKGDQYSLKIIDLQSNRIRDLAEINHLSILSQLEEVYIEMGKNTNPCCTIKSLYYQSLENLPQFKKLQVIDGHSPEQIVNYLENNQQNEVRSNNRQQSNRKNNAGATLKNDRSGSSNRAPNDKLRTDRQEEDNPKKNQINEEISRELQAQYQSEIISLKQQNDNLKETQQQLIYKFECNQKFWVNKCEQQNQDVQNLNDQNKELNNTIQQLKKQNTKLESDIQQIKSEKDRHSMQHDKKQELVETLQQRITDLIKDNGEYHRELAQKASDIESLRAQIKEKQRNTVELRGKLMENEKTLTEFHSKSIETNGANLLRNQEMRRKYEAVFEENKAMIIQNSHLKERVSELLELCREWQLKHEKQMDELNYKSDQEKTKLTNDYENTITRLKQISEDERREQETEFKENLDMLEKQFQKVLIENNDQFRQLQQSYDERVKEESQLQQILRGAVDQNQQFQQLINELQSALIKLQQDVGVIQKEQQDLVNELDQKQKDYNRDVGMLQEQREHLLQRLGGIEQKMAEEGQRFASETGEIQQMRAQLRDFQDMQNRIQELQSTLAAKNQMLDDQNETIYQLKKTTDDAKKSEQQANQEYERLAKQLDQQYLIIEELEQQLAQAGMESENIQKELREKKDLISLFEGEIEQVRQTQLKQVQDVRQGSSEKDEKINYLIGVLDQCQDSIKNQDSQIMDLEQEINRRRAEFSEKQQSLISQSKNYENEIKELQRSLNETQSDMQQLVEEVEKQKKQARQQLAQLNKFFGQ